jgi:hypothetical protein
MWNVFNLAYCVKPTRVLKVCTNPGDMRSLEFFSQEGDGFTGEKKSQLKIFMGSTGSEEEHRIRPGEVCVGIYGEYYTEKCSKMLKSYGLIFLK